MDICSKQSFNYHYLFHLSSFDILSSILCVESVLLVDKQTFSLILLEILLMFWIFLQLFKTSIYSVLHSIVYFEE